MAESLERLSDASLLARCRREPEAFLVVYDRHARSLLTWARWQSGDTDVALDIVQETFARALRDAHRFRAHGDGSALPWLRTIARNLVRDWRRRGRVEDRTRRQLGIEAGPDVETQTLADARLDATMRHEELRAALSRLHIDQRTAVEARVVSGASYDEIARSMGITEQTARARVSRGLRTLRVLLQLSSEETSR